MTDEASVAILLERRGTMNDPAMVDAFIKARHQIMPAAEPGTHPVLRTLGEARVADVGALLWTILRQTLPCETMGVFVPDIERDEIALRYVAGAHAAELRGATKAAGAGVVGWVAVNLRTAVNADPGLDFGARVRELSPALRSCLAIPLVSSDCLVAVLAFYRSESNAFAEDDLRLLELLAPRLALAIDAAVEAEDMMIHPTPTVAQQSLKLVKSR